MKATLPGKGLSDSEPYYTELLEIMTAPGINSESSL